jgi:hypothetical protein
VLVLEKIEACREEITLSCGMDLSFNLDTFVGRLEDIAAAKEAAHAAKREEAENRHKAIVDACPALVEYCGLPLELPAGPAKGEEPSLEDLQTKHDLHRAMKCVYSNQGDVEIGQACEDVLADLKAERKEHEAGHEAGHEVFGLDEELKTMMAEVRDCVQDHVKPALDPLDDDNVCAAALAHPDNDHSRHHWHDETDEDTDDEASGEAEQGSIVDVGGLK